MKQRNFLLYSLTNVGACGSACVNNELFSNLRKLLITDYKNVIRYWKLHFGEQWYGSHLAWTAPIYFSYFPFEPNLRRAQWFKIKWICVSTKWLSLLEWIITMNYVLSNIIVISIYETEHWVFENRIENWRYFLNVLSLFYQWTKLIKGHSFREIIWCQV